MQTLDSLARFVLWGAIVLFTGIGLTGVLLGGFEFIWLYPVELDGPVETVRNQQRFLKALELSWGVALFVLRRDVFVRRDITALVLFLFWITPVARLLSMAVDGWPHPHFVALVCVELTAAGILSARAAARAMFREHESLLFAGNRRRTW